MWGLFVGTTNLRLGNFRKTDRIDPRRSTTVSERVRVESVQRTFPVTDRGLGLNRFPETARRALLHSVTSAGWESEETSSSVVDEMSTYFVISL